jgi:hypothetical protein
MEYPFDVIAGVLITVVGPRCDLKTFEVSFWLGSTKKCLSKVSNGCRLLNCSAIPMI